MVIRSGTPVTPTRKPPPGPISGAAFWALMERWGIPDEQALRLIGDTQSPSGKRPRFALSTEQVEQLELLREIDRHASDVYQEAGGWLRRPNPCLVFAGLSPLAYMIRDGRDGIETVLRRVHMMTSGRSLADKRRGR